MGVAAFVAVLVGLGTARDDVLVAAISAGTIALAFLVPAPSVAVIAVVLTAGPGSAIPGLSDSQVLGIASALAIVVTARGLLSRSLAPGQAVAGTAIALLLALAAANTYLSADAVTVSDIARDAAPYTLGLLVLTPLDRGDLGRALQLAAFCILVLGTLYIATTLTGASAYPGTYRQIDASLLGFPIHRSYAPGGTLLVFGCLWSLAVLARRDRGDGAAGGLAMAVLAVSSLAVLSTASRTVVVGLIAASLAAVILATRSTLRPGRMAGLGLVAAVAGALALGPGLSAGYEEIRSASGNFGARVDLVDEAADQVREHPLLGAGLTGGGSSSVGVGLATESLATGDSSFVTITVQFGLLGVAVLSALALTVASASIRLLRNATTESYVGALAVSLISFSLIAGFTTDSLIAPTGIGLLALISAAVYRLAAEAAPEALADQEAEVANQPAQAHFRRGAVGGA